MKEDIKYILPYSGVILIIFGFIKFEIFYALFGINIANFLDLTEILTLFMNDILIHVSIFIIVSLLFFLIIPKKETDIGNALITETIKEKSFWKRLKAYNGSGVNTLFVFTSYIALCIISYFVDNTQTWIYLSISFLIIGSFIIYILCLEFRRQYFIKHNSFLSTIYIRFIYYISFIILITIKSAYTDYKLILINKPYSGTIIKTEKKTYISTKKFYYIGMTKNYIFFHNEIDNSNRVIPISEVKEILIKKS